MKTPDIQTLATEAARLYYTGEKSKAISMASLTFRRLDQAGKNIFNKTYEQDARILQNVGDTYDLWDNIENMSDDEITLAKKVIAAREAVA
jgi:hypothetical protein